jgi:hypothetical protein
MRLATVWPLSGRPQMRCRADHAKRNPNVVGITVFRLALHHAASADSISRTRMRCQYSRACRSGDVVGVDRPVTALRREEHAPYPRRRGNHACNNEVSNHEVLTIEARTGLWAREGWRE